MWALCILRQWARSSEYRERLSNIVIAAVLPRARQKPKTADLQTYPNPFKDEFYINSPNADEFEIYDISGKLVQSGKVNSGKVSAPKLQKGFYLVKIIMENGEAVTKKIIKE